jgi:hypothetical protein
MGVLVILNMILFLIPDVELAGAEFVSVQGGVGMGCACPWIGFLVCAGIGVLAGVYLIPPRDIRAGASAGASAGALSGAGASIMTIITTAVYLALVGNQLMVDDTASYLIAEWTATYLNGGLCCLGWMAIGAGLGALGGLIFAAAKSD